MGLLVGDTWLGCLLDAASPIRDLPREPSTAVCRNDPGLQTS
jgi:hypothetical protein